jgi:dipeptidyl aminopeptidase/acylaminoacyl peptidase
MAHRSAVSPDGAWVLIAEMNRPVWQPCRLVPAIGQSTGRPVGPGGGCTSAAWSPDGKWMYFSSNSSGTYHIWRQRFPDGKPEQLTFGPTEEEGIAPDPDGRSLLTSVGIRRQSIWMDDERGEHEISREGYAFVPTLPNGGVTQPLAGNFRSIFYLVRQGAVRFAGVGERAGELWATDVETGRPRPILAGRPVVGYDVSRDGTQIVFAALEESGASHIWVSRADGSEARRLTDLEANGPRFDSAGNIYFRHGEFIYRLREGREPEKAIQQPVLFFMTTSPRGEWLIARVQTPADRGGNHFNAALPTTGGPPVRLCDQCEVDWTPNGSALVIRLGSDGPEAMPRTFVVALEPGVELPPWPANGVRSRKDLGALRILGDFERWVYPSDDLSVSVFPRRSTQRNIHRVPLP